MTADPPDEPSQGPPEPPEPGWADRLVERVAGLMNAVGLNGTRMLWRWRNRQRNLGEAGLRTEIMFRSARGKHKMCPSCRALVARDSAACPDCGTNLRRVRAPGFGRLVTNLLPGITAATSLIMLVNGFWFVMMTMAAIRAGLSVGFMGFGDLELLVRFGAGLSFKAALQDGSVTGGEWWRLITPIFLHSGLIHFFFNTYLLMQLGPLVEEFFGSARFWAIYLACGIAGSMASQWTHPVITVGASGAIMGLIGLLLVYGFTRGDTALGQAMKGLLWRLVIYTVILAAVFNIDHRNHIGGFVCGALLALVVPARSPLDRGESRVWQIVATAGVLLVVLAFYQVAAQGRLGAG